MNQILILGTNLFFLEALKKGNQAGMNHLVLIFPTVLAVRTNTTEIMEADQTEKVKENQVTETLATKVQVHVRVNHVTFLIGNPVRSHV